MVDPPGSPAASRDASDQEAATPVVPPARRRRLLLVLFGVALTVIVLDQVTKYWIVTFVRTEGEIRLLGGFLTITYTENTGAAFSMGTGYTWIFTIIAVVVAAVILRSTRRLGSLAWAVALGGLLGGLLGNLVDRLTRPPTFGGDYLFGHGYVVDWIQLPHFAVFNVADSAIVCSAILMVLLALRGYEFTGGRTA